MLTVTVAVLLAAFVMACIGAQKPNVLWVAVVLLAIAGLLEIWPR
jgi:hypothetical protein